MNESNYLEHTLPWKKRSNPFRSNPVAVKAPQIIISGGAICHGIFASFSDKKKYEIWKKRSNTTIENALAVPFMGLIANL